MKKYLLFFLFFLIASISLFSAQNENPEASFIIYNTANNINLDDPDNIFMGYEDNSDYESSLVASVGISHSKDTKISLSDFSFLGVPWVFTSSSDLEKNVKFGIDVVLRADNKNEKLEKIVSLGYADDTLHKDTEWSYTDSSQGNGSYKYIYFDFLLVVPDDESLPPADDYYVSFNITVSGDDIQEQVYHCVLTGYAGETEFSSQVILNVVPSPAATSINIDDPNVQPYSSGYEIGSYYYSTVSLLDRNDLNYRAFVSASEDPERTKEDGFTLKILFCTVDIKS